MPRIPTPADRLRALQRAGYRCEWTLRGRVCHGYAGQIVLGAKGLEARCNDHVSQITN